MTNHDKQNRELKGVVYFHELDKRKKPLLSDYKVIAVAVLAAVSFVVGGWPV